VLIGIHSKDLFLSSRYRLKVITDKVKLKNLQPVADTITNAGDYKYYYFTNNVTVINPNANWEFIVSLSVTSALGDADLFISAIDGRNPNSEDYDFAS
jgi:hypothetical protein